VKKKPTKIIFVTGGVVSSLGKGLAAASLGSILESRGLKISLQKLDPYINVDPGTMNPLQHGEVFVTEDGAETDLDLGHYERFTTATLTQHNNITSGQIYFDVISRERRGEFLGGTVQVIPHITDAIKEKILVCAQDVDILICEVGGTVGDIEGLPFLEAIRQLRIELGPQNSVSIHLTLIPYLKAAGELKTKPTQHSVMKLREIGIQPEILLCRTEHALPQELKEKIGLFCNVSPNAVFEAPDVKTIYELPLVLQREGLDDKVSEYLNIWTGKPQLTEWESIVSNVQNPERSTTIAVVGKYVELKESYKSLNEALIHGGLAHGAEVNLRYIDSERLESDEEILTGDTSSKRASKTNHVAAILDGVDGVLIPGGFGNRGIEGKINAIRYARESRIPFFGICLGMQLAAVEFARNVMNLPDANSTEFAEACHNPVIHLMEAQTTVNNKGGTMRLGGYDCQIMAGSLAEQIYGTEFIRERHRHRYEFNNAFRAEFEERGMCFSGHHPDLDLVEILELPQHPFYIACQFHPEFKSKPTAAHPLFREFIGAAIKSQASRSRRNTTSSVGDDIPLTPPTLSTIPEELTTDVRNKSERYGKLQ